MLEDGDIVRLRGIRSVAEAGELRRAGMASAERLKSGRCPENWKEHLGAGEDAYFYLPYFTALVLGVTLKGADEESPPPTELGWLELSSKVPMVFDAVRRQVDTVLNVASAAFRTEHVEKKSARSDGTSENGTGSS